MSENENEILDEIVEEEEVEKEEIVLDLLNQWSLSWSLRMSSIQEYP